LRASNHPIGHVARGFAGNRIELHKLLDSTMSDALTIHENIEKIRFVPGIPAG